MRFRQWLAALIRPKCTNPWDGYREGAALHLDIETGELTEVKTVTLTCWGGPWDGERRELPVGSDRLPCYVPMFQRVPDDDYDPFDLMDGIDRPMKRHGTYHLSGFRLVWRAE